MALPLFSTRRMRLLVSRARARPRRRGRRSKARKATSFLTAVFLIASIARISPARADILGDIRYDGEFIRSLQMANGAIYADTSRTLVDPYLGNYAALGLARATTATNDRRYVNAALRWLTWYQGNMDSGGIVHDQRVVNGSLQRSDDEDSADATSGAFLLAVREVYLASPGSTGRGIVRRLRPGIVAAVQAINSLRDSDGMTWAKASWRVKYLMDNSEAYAGQLAAGDLGTVLGDQSLTAKALDGASRSRAGLLTLWNPATEAYDWALHANGYRQVADLTVLYPDSVEQVWTVAYGVSDASRSSQIMTRFGAQQPAWDRPTATATFWDGTPYRHTVDFWPVVGWAYAAAGDPSTPAIGASHIRDGAWQINRQAPYTSGAQGQLIVLESPTRQPG
jgi:hypothetical protein